MSDFDKIACAASHFVKILDGRKTKFHSAKSRKAQRSLRARADPASRKQSSHSAFSKLIAEGLGHKSAQLDIDTVK